MKCADKLVCLVAAVLLSFALTCAPANAQFGLGGGGGGGGGGGEDMMTQMAPMLDMMKAKMGKRRFAQLMQTMGPMMGQMMEGGGGGFGGGNMTSMLGGGGTDIMGMIGPMMQLANLGSHRRHRRHR
jgi:hypothetical protein